ncbi:hypothetical protein C8R43DRAFT_953079 [Mycena crocata]|nr:hypothetical protein C8R43DRAFT_953079 [Mycena crocata]
MNPELALIFPFIETRKVITTTTPAGLQLSRKDRNSAIMNVVAKLWRNETALNLMEDGGATTWRRSALSHPTNHISDIHHEESADEKHHTLQPSALSGRIAMPNSLHDLCDAYSPAHRHQHITPILDSGEAGGDLHWRAGGNATPEINFRSPAQRVCISKVSADRNGSAGAHLPEVPKFLSYAIMPHRATASLEDWRVHTYAHRQIEPTFLSMLLQFDSTRARPPRNCSSPTKAEPYTRTPAPPFYLVQSCVGTATRRRWSGMGLNRNCVHMLGMGIPPELPTLPPRAFYDKHLDDKLSLRHVKRMPSLPKGIATLASDYVDSISKTSLFHLLPSEGIPTSYRPSTGPKVIDAADVAAFYDRTTGMLCTRIATKTHLIPKQPDWSAKLFWCRAGNSADGRLARDEQYGLSLYHDAGELALVQEELDWMGEDMVVKLKATVSRVPDLGFDRIAIQSTFPFATCRTVQFPPGLPSHFRPLDAAITPWTIPLVLQTAQTVRPSNDQLKVPANADNISGSSTPQKSQSTLKKSKGSPKTAIPAVSHRPDKTEHPNSKLTAESLLQLTLYVLDLIDVTACKDPGYVQLHVGLDIAIMQDTFKRVGQQIRAEDAVSVEIAQKRHYSEDISVGAAKLRKTSHVTSEELASEVRSHHPWYPQKMFVRRISSNVIFWK